MDSVKGEFSISEKQHDAFARFSGDFNPIHVDPIYARRLPFGGVVVHGVHSLLRSLDAVFSTMAPGYSRLTELTASFPGAVQLGESLQFRAESSADNRFKIVVSRGGKRVVIVTFRSSDDPHPSDGDEVVDRPPPVELPELLAFPPEYVSGEVSLFTDRGLGGQLFPSLDRTLARVQFAQILATTRIVGMRCPGLNSLFVGLRLEFGVAGILSGSSSVRYATAHIDERYRRARISVTGHGLEGELDTFFRVGPVEQPSFADVRRAVRPDEFAQQRALVVGGTRGVGEVTAKLLAAGGADVLLTYMNGIQGAERIRKEIIDSGGKCKIESFDATQAARDTARIVDAGWLPTHLYFFASPRIARNESGAWNDALFESYNEFYVAGFRSVVEKLAETTEHIGGRLSVFFPSSVYVETPQKGFAEYAASKSAGEAACSELGARFDNVSFASPRLPRMRTDQTSGLLIGDVEEPLAVMVACLCGARPLD